jgi:hypothetical protein
MPKIMLHLSINPDIANMAKSSGMNLSKEFEEWLRIRIENIGAEKPIIDRDFEIAKYRAEIQKLESQKDMEQQLKDKQKEELLVLDGVIDNMVEYKDDLTNPSDNRCHGIQFLFQRKFKKVLNPLQVKELLEKRIKERGLIG